MKRLDALLAVVILLWALALSGCSGQATPAKATQAPSSGVSASPAPTAAPAVQSTAIPTAVNKLDYPQKGKAISFIVPFPAGGGTDVNARILAIFLEKELGIPVNVVNKGGAGSQVGVTELANSKPDGYTIGIMTLPNVPLIYLNPDRKAAFSRKDLQPVANHAADVGVIAVKANSPFKSVTDLVQAAKANPGKIRLSTTGLLGPHHIAILQLQKLAGVEFTIVHFEGSAPALTALMGDHIDAAVGFGADLLPQARTQEVRILGVMDKSESKFLPGVKTFEAQGYNMNFAGVRVVAAPAKTPKEIVDTLSGIIKRSLADEDQKKKLDELGVAPRYMDPDTISAYWGEVESQVKPLLEEAMKTPK